MLSQCVYGKINAHRVSVLRLYSARLLSTLLKNPLLERILLPRVEQTPQQCICYHNSEAEATGVHRQDHLRKQQAKAKYLQLKGGHNGKSNRRIVIPSLTTNTRHLGPQQKQQPQQQQQQQQQTQQSPLTGVRSTTHQAQLASSKDCAVDNIRKYSTTAREKLFKEISKPAKRSKRKVTVVGSGQVGMAVVMATLSQGIANEVCIIDANEKLVKAEAKDMQHGSIFLNDAKIDGSKDFKASEESTVCVVTAGARQKEGQSRLDLLKTNIDIFGQIIPKLVKHSPKAILLIISNPCDILTYAAWKLSGLPKEQVFGTGTHLDTARFRYFISQRLGVAPSSVHGYIIGEHGDSSVPVWSSVNVGGTRLRDLNKCIGTAGDTEKYGELGKAVVKAAYEVIAGKGYTNWAIGLTAASVISMILDNQQKVATVSTLAKEQQGLDHNIFLSLPAVIGANGITSLVNLNLSEREQKNLCNSADVLDKTTRSIDDKLPKKEKC